MQSRLNLYHTISTEWKSACPQVRITQIQGVVRFMLGIVWAKSVALPKIAEAFPAAAQKASVEIQLRRFLRNDRAGIEMIWRAVRRERLWRYAGTNPTLIFDPTPFRGRFTGLVIGLVHGPRVLPLDVVLMPQQTPWETSMVAALRPMLERIAEDLPPECQVTILADRGLIGPGIVRVFAEFGWNIVLRMRGVKGDQTRVQLPDGTETSIYALLTTAGQRWNGPVRIFKQAGWCAGYLTIHWPRRQQEPLVLFSTRVGGHARVVEYRRRVHIEATFADLKGRLMHFERSRVTDPARLRRLFQVAALAIWWLTELGDRAVKAGRRRQYDYAPRKKRGPLKRGLCYLQECLANDRLPAGITPLPAIPQSVRK